MRTYNQSGMTLLELLVCIIILGVLAALLLPALARVNPHRGMGSCQNNLKQFGLIFKMYADESEGNLFPPMMIQDVARVDCDGQPPQPPTRRGIASIAPSMRAIYPEYLTDPGALICPTEVPGNWLRGPSRRVDPAMRAAMLSEDGKVTPNTYCDEPGLGARAADNSYFYFGYVFDKTTFQPDTPQPFGPAQFTAAFMPVVAQISENDWAEAQRMVDGDLTVAAGLGNGGEASTTIYRLREGVERSLVADVNDPREVARVQSQIWIMGDQIYDTSDEYKHRPGGANVLFLDGHVEFIRYPMDQAAAMAPVNEAMANAMDVIRDLGEY